jgi:hypothetical protein
VQAINQGEKMEFEMTLNTLLEQKRKVDLEIAKLITESSEGKIRFSAKKFIGDLGEFYFLKSATLFSDLEQSRTSNSDCDFVGILNEDGQRTLEIGPEKVRIEVKTRHAQSGDNHIFGVNKAKFDLLAFVALADDLTCRHIGIIRSIDIGTVDKQKRITYSPYYTNGLVRWRTNEWIEL